MSNQIRNVIIFAEDKTTANLLKNEFVSVSKGFNVLGAYTDSKVMHADNKYEGSAMYVVNIAHDCPNVIKYLDSLKLENKKTTCIISDNKSHAKLLDKHKIFYLKSPITPDDILRLLKRFHKVKEDDGEDLDEKSKALDKKTKPISAYLLKKQAKLALLIGCIFRTENGEQLFDLNLIKRIYNNDKEKKVFIVWMDDTEIRIMETITDAKNRLRKDNFELRDRGELLNVIKITGFSKDNKIVYMEDEAFDVDHDQIIDLHLAWIKYNNLPKAK